MIKNDGNFCYKLDFAAATPCRDTQASSKAGSRARVGSAYIAGGWMPGQQTPKIARRVPDPSPR